MKIMDASYRWLMDEKKKTRSSNNVIENSFTIIFTATSLLIAILYVVNSFLVLPYINYISIMLYLSTMLPFLQESCRGLGMKKLYAVSGVLLSLFMVFFSILGVFLFENKVAAILLSYIISYALVIIILLVKGRFATRIKFNFQDTKGKFEMLAYSIPLLFNAVSWWVINASDRYIILYFLEVDQNGIYAISSRFPAIIVIVNSVIMLAWQDMVIDSGDNDGNYFSNVFDKFLTFELTFAAICAAISQVLVTNFVGNDFYDAWLYMPLLFVGVSFSALSGFLGAGYLKFKKTRGIFYTSLIAALINLSITIIGMPFIGLYAAALGTLIGFLAMFIIRYVQIKKVLNLKIDLVKIIFLILYSLIIISCLIYVPQFEYLILTVTLLIFFWQNRSLFAFFYKLGIKKLSKN